MKRLTAAIGTFDGVHRGHLAVLGEVTRLARTNGSEPVAFTFDRHPLQLIAPLRAPLAIATPEKKRQLFEAVGVSPIVLEFDEELRNTTAREWMSRLKNEFGVETLVVGYDNTFGSDGVNLSIADYRVMGKEIGIEVVEAPEVPGISSSAIRKAIASGDIAKANEMLGRRFLLPGIVVEGNKLGRTLGFPTANLLPEPGIVLPANGVYAAAAILPDGSKHPAVVNIGVRPTVMRGNNLTIEAHIIGWKGDLYGHTLKLAFQAWIRPETQFNSIEALRRQIEKDVQTAKLLLPEAAQKAK